MPCPPHAPHPIAAMFRAAVCVSELLKAMTLDVVGGTAFG